MWVNVFQNQIITKYIYFKHMGGLLHFNYVLHGSFHLCWDETTSQKTTGILQLMPELSMERMQSWISNHGSTIDSTNIY